MNDHDRRDLIEHLRLDLTRDRGTGLAPSSDIAVLVAAALLAPSDDPLIAATSRATATSDRQFVTIAAAHVAGDHERVDALVRDHLLDHPSRPLLEWIVARGRPFRP